MGHIFTIDVSYDYTCAEQYIPSAKFNSIIYIEGFTWYILSDNSSSDIIIEHLEATPIDSQNDVWYYQNKYKVTINQLSAIINGVGAD